MENKPFSIKEWQATPEYKRLKKLAETNISEVVSKEFFRDPLRPIFRKPEVFYSAADGVVLDTHHDIGADECIVEVKGRKFTTKDLLNNPEYNERSLVVSVFMTFFNVHTNRIPTDSYIVEAKETPYIFSHGLSMLDTELDLFNKKKLDKDTQTYLFKNQRKIITCYSPEIAGHYYCIS